MSEELNVPQEWLDDVFPAEAKNPVTVLDEAAPETDKLTLQEAPVEKKYDPHADWQQFVGALREARIQQIAKATGQSPVRNPIPEEALDEHGRPLQYAKDKNEQPRYAYDNAGRLSLGVLASKHSRRRIKPHMNKRQLAVKALALAEFRRLFAALSAELSALAVKEGREFEGIPMHLMGKISAEAVQTAAAQYKINRRRERKQRRQRQQISRRINFGLIPGNSDRRAHAQAPAY